MNIPTIREGKKRLEPKKKYLGNSRIPKKRALYRNAHLGSEIDLRHKTPISSPTNEMYRPEIGQP
jgi:hypothetical protein